jgi:hypothetical protein
MKKIPEFTSESEERAFWKKMTQVTTLIGTKQNLQFFPV